MILAFALGVHMERSRRSKLLAIALLAVPLLAVGCSRITIPAWINIDESQSSLAVTLLGTTLPVAVEGGFFAEIVVDPSALLSGVVTGTVRLEDVRIAAKDDGRVLGTLCLWRNTDVSDVGQLRIDVFAGTSSLELPIALRAYSTRLAPLLLSMTGSDVIEVTPELGDGGVPLAVDPQALITSLQTGSVTNLIELPVVLGQEIELGGLSSEFVMDLLLRTGDQSPEMDPANVETCQEFWDRQGRQRVFPVNSKGTYLRYAWDAPQPPTTVELADIGAAPGDVLRIKRRGNYYQWIGGPPWADVVALFSSSSFVSGDPLAQYRVPGAIEAGDDVWTPSTYNFGLYTDIPQDFSVMNTVEVVVPPGATHLLFTTLSEFFADNTNNGLRVELTVNP